MRLLPVRTFVAALGGTTMPNPNLRNAAELVIAALDARLWRRRCARRRRSDLQKLRRRRPRRPSRRLRPRPIRCPMGIVLALAQFVEEAGGEGGAMVPGPARAEFLYREDGEWQCRRYSKTN